MAKIYRYDTSAGVMTPLDPLEDVTSWIAGLRSKGYTSDILRSVHSFTSAPDIAQSAHLIRLFAENALGLMEQAFSGPPEVSFLPIYYALLNLSKVCVILSGNRKLLEANRWHGLSYNPSGKTSRDLMTEQLTIRNSGAFHLFYRTLTGAAFPPHIRSIGLRRIYPFIRGITHEYFVAYKLPSPFQPVDIDLLHEVPNKYRIVVSLGPSRDPHSGNKRYLRPFARLHKTTKEGKVVLESATFTASNPHGALASASRIIARHLLYHSTDTEGSLLTLVPLSTQRFHIPEELPIWIAFYHLANVVRYNPEFLSRLIDSKAWPMLLGLRKHATLRFLLAFWSFVRRSSIFISTP